jgi:hypothetical protein
LSDFSCISSSEKCDSPLASPYRRTYSVFTMWAPLKLLGLSGGATAARPEPGDAARKMNDREMLARDAA